MATAEIGDEIQMLGWRQVVKHEDDITRCDAQSESIRPIKNNDRRWQQDISAEKWVS